MKSVSQFLSDPAVAAALICCVVLSAADVAMRLLPERPRLQTGSTEIELSVFSRAEPGGAWNDWRAVFLQERAEAEKKVLEAQSNRSLEGEPDAIPGASLADQDDQQGDVETLNVEGLSYQLLGVFNKVSKTDEGDVFAVLQSERDQSAASSTARSLTIREGDSVGGYKVQLVRSRSVIFRSTIDDRLVTLWLFRNVPQ